MSAEPPTPPKPIAPGNHAVAWNDPPLFSVGVNTTSRAPSKKLTARVGFPMNSGGAGVLLGGGCSGSASLPPNLPSNPAPLPPTVGGFSQPPGENAPTCPPAAAGETASGIVMPS